MNTNDRNANAQMVFMGMIDVVTATEDSNTDDKMKNLYKSLRPSQIDVLNQFIEREDPAAMAYFENKFPALTTPLKKEGQMTSKDLARQYKCIPPTVAQCLQKLYDEQATTKNEAGEEIPVVVRVKAGPKICLALNDGRDARTALMKACQNITGQQLQLREDKNVGLPAVLKNILVSPPDR